MATTCPQKRRGTSRNRTVFCHHHCGTAVFICRVSKRQFYLVMCEAVLTGHSVALDAVSLLAMNCTHVASERSSRLISPNVPRLAPGGPGIEPRWTRGHTPSTESRGRKVYV